MADNNTDSPKSRPSRRTKSTAGDRLTVGQRLDRLFHGRWLSTRFFNRHWGLMLTVTVMFVLYIGQRYDCLNKMEHVQRLEKRLNTIKSEYIRERALYMASTREIEMTRRVHEHGLDLTIGQKPPYHIDMLK